MKVLTWVLTISLTYVIRVEFTIMPIQLVAGISGLLLRDRFLGDFSVLGLLEA